ncbi:MAG: hypothetical protein AAFY71_24675 [Bacteroidota bacterium]
MLRLMIFLFALMTSVFVFGGQANPTVKPSTDETLHSSFEASENGELSYPKVKESKKHAKKANRLSKKLNKAFKRIQAGSGAKFLLAALLMMIFFIVGIYTFHIPLLGELFLLLAVLCFIMAARFFIDWLVHL